ncbi:MAG: hypothetical protein QXJ59_06945 [Thermofilaceae archaeon]
MSATVKASCNLKNRELTYEEYFSSKCEEYLPFDPNLALLVDLVPEVMSDIEPAARCWNCRYSLLTVSYRRIVEEAPPEEEAPTEKKEGEG